MHSALVYTNSDILVWYARPNTCNMINKFLNVSRAPLYSNPRTLPHVHLLQLQTVIEKGCHLWNAIKTRLLRVQYADRSVNVRYLISIIKIGDTLKFHGTFDIRFILWIFMKYFENVIYLFKTRFVSSPVKPKTTYGFRTTINCFNINIFCQKSVKLSRDYNEQENIAKFNVGWVK